MRVTARSLLLAGAAVFLASCAGQAINGKLPAFDGTSGYRFDKLSLEGNANDLFVILAFSGGGTRAAAFSFGVMEGLRETRYQAPAGQRALLEDVDVISSVSGGSFTAAYYGLFRDRLFADFPNAFLYRNIQSDLVLRALSPVNWVRLASPTFDRIDLAAELYDEEVFEHKSFADLLSQPRKPYIVLNATDMTLGHRFEFTQDQFDLLCSDLGPVKVANGVAASSAFPGLLSPLTLKNFAAEGCGYKAPQWLLDSAQPGSPMPRYVRARDALSYQDRQAGRAYVHLLDGGLADNIGLRGPYAALSSDASPWSVLSKINQGSIRRVVVITANAKTKASHDWDHRRRAPGLLDVLGFVSSGPMDNYSFDTVQMVRDFFTQMNADAQSWNLCTARINASCPAAATDDQLPVVDFFAVELSFDAVDDEALRSCLDNLPTSFALPKPTVDLLRVVARSLLMGSKDFRAAMGMIDSAWTPSPVTVDPSLRAEVCATSPPR
jgi:predicted acylesterase/phospholipase RssA